ncbi:twin-arginine translocation signal domain-containing protein [Halocatena marina]|uniref:Twin-arginine translocation signal domain-containing protein n=1 Tax=Halocatena marina TaxID=2934937 RepID=A0ABD5YPM4_9EURY|nr:twin-arginine translocation signal domain-containing protein [Halocatena marina]
MTAWTPNGLNITRRGFLKTAGVAGVIGGGLTGVDMAAGGAKSKPHQALSPAHDPSQMSETHVDIADGDDVAGIIENVSDGELLVFPEGEFRWSRTVLVTVDNWGIRGQPNDGTVFMVPEGHTGRELTDYHLRTIAKSSLENPAGDNILLKNLTFDSTGRTNPGIRIGVRNRGHVENLHYRCNGTIGPDLMPSGMNALVQNKDGHLTIRNYVQHNNGRLSDYNGGDSRSGFHTGAGNFGTVTLIDPVLTGFPNNGCYVSRTPGRTEIVGGYLANNNVSNVRLSGAVTVCGTTMELDTETYATGDGETTGGNDYNTRMVWGDARQTARGPGGLVENCSFILHSYDRSQGLVDILDNPSITVRNSQFLLEDEITAVSADAGEIVLNNCTFTGESSATAGSGDITGDGNCVSGDIEPGDVPTSEQNCRSFEWNRVHPLGQSS